MDEEQRPTPPEGVDEAKSTEEMPPAPPAPEVQQPEPSSENNGA